MQKNHRNTKLFISAICVITSWSFIIYMTIAQGQDDVRAQEERLAPMPTEMSRNFMRQVNSCFIPIASVYGYTLRVNSGFRTLEEQDQIYQQGRTVDGHIVSESPAGRSIHNYGYAVDVVDRWRGFDINWEKLDAIGRYCGLEHDMEDRPHFELRGGLTTYDFEAGRRPPILHVPCRLMEERAVNNEPLTRQDLKICNVPSF